MARVARVADAETLVPNDDDEVIYLDSNRVIHVFDPVPQTEYLQVEWASPGAGWEQIALGDVTGDGDVEIVAIRREGNRGWLTIFDPVAQDSPEDLVEFQNGVPWATLFELELEPPPRLVATGEFDPARPGVEIIYSYAVSDEDDEFVILRSTGEGAPGRDWEVQRTWQIEGRWSAIATGNVHTEDAIDEVALVSNALGELGLWRVEPNVVRTFTNVNRDHRWVDVAIGQYVATGNDGAEIGAVRDADFPLASVWVFRYDGNRFVDALGEVLLPSPNKVFFVNIRNAVDEELVILRQVQQELGPRPRLVIRDGGNNDTLAMSEALLDGDNEYRGADGGDIDGDGDGEIVLVRNNRIRIYTEPETSAAFDLYERFTNGEVVRVGNVDAAGLAQRPRLVASRTQIRAQLQPGQVGETFDIEVQDVTKGAIMAFEVLIDGADDWVIIEQADNLTPATFSVTLDATNVSPGEYRGRLLVDVATSNVEHDPLEIELSLTVGSILRASPASVDFVYYPCIEPIPLADPRNVVTTTLRATGNYTYSVLTRDLPAWLGVAPTVGTLPDVVTVTVDPAARPADFVTFDLPVLVDLPSVPGVLERIPVHVACPTMRTHAPLIAR